MADTKSDEDLTKDRKMAQDSPAMQPSAAAVVRTASAASIDAGDTTVRVALRARPLVARERLDGAKV